MCVRYAEGLASRILVVDDNAINQLAAVRAIHSLGYAADAVAGGEAALEALSRASYRAVLMDCQMPGIDGFQTARAIRRREALDRLGRVPIIAMTANGADRDPEKCVAAGMDDYLAKPFRIAELDRALERWTGVREFVQQAG
jgi:CheY-like chemotaxis protein